MEQGRRLARGGRGSRCGHRLRLRIRPHLRLKNNIFPCTSVPQSARETRSPEPSVPPAALRDYIQSWLPRGGIARLNATSESAQGILVSLGKRRSIPSPSPYVPSRSWRTYGVSLSSAWPLRCPGISECDECEVYRTVCHDSNKRWLVAAAASTEERASYANESVPVVSRSGIRCRMRASNRWRREGEVRASFAAEENGDFKVVNVKQSGTTHEQTTLISFRSRSSRNLRSLAALAFAFVRF